MARLTTVAPLGGAVSGHRRGERRAIAALIVAFWVLFQIVYFLHGALKDPNFPVIPGVLAKNLILYVISPLEVAIVSCGALLCYGTYAFLSPLRHYSLARQLPAALAASLTCAIGFAAFVSLACEIFDVPWPPMTPRFLFTESMKWVAPFGLWAGIALTVTYNSEMRDRERRLTEAREQAQEAQVRALRYQVNPHFLYNTLNAIAALILDGRNEHAERMVIRLSDFFRASLANDPTHDVALADELSLQRLYLDIEQMRFAGDLVVEIDVPDELSRAQVPSLILQPLVENVLKHGVNEVGRQTLLQISARRDHENLLLEVADNGPGLSAGKGTGLGLENVRRRLAARYGLRAGIEAGRRAGGGFAVRLQLPLEVT